MLFSKNKKFCKLIDFGYANICKHRKKRERYHDAKGTPYYMSPEVYRGSYDKRCDLWSMGVITYQLLSGSMPFNAKDLDQLEELILTCDYNFDAPIWREVSRDAKNFIEGLIEPQVKDRFTCDQALKHPWITRYQNNSDNLDE